MDPRKYMIVDLEKKGDKQMFVTEQISYIKGEDNGLYTVKFFNSQRVFRYNQSRLLYFDNPESIEAIRFFTSDKVFYDPVYVGYTSNSDTPLNTPAINSMLKGNDYQQEFDAVKEQYTTNFKSIFAS